MGGGWGGVRQEIEKTHVYSSYESKKHQLLAQTSLERLTDISLALRSISGPCLLFDALHRAYCLSCDFTGLAAQFTLE